MSIFHVARHADWHAAIVAGEYRVSTLDGSLDTVGFIHASESHQVAGVIERFYRGQQDLVILVIDESAVTSAGTEVRREDSGNGELFPHIYGPLLPEWVVRVRTVV
jgi:uncharacterized protein (DUF952 family)